MHMSLASSEFCETCLRIGKSAHEPCLIQVLRPWLADEALEEPTSRISSSTKALPSHCGSRNRTTIRFGRIEGLDQHFGDSRKKIPLFPTEATVSNFYGELRARVWYSYGPFVQ